MAEATTDGNSTRSARSQSGDGDRAATKTEAAALDARGVAGSSTGCRVAATNIRWLEGSISRPWALKKSIPNIGRATAARRKFTTNCLVPNCTLTAWMPQEVMGRPSAPTSRGPVGGNEELKGQTLMAAPVSARNAVPVMVSVRKISLPPVEEMTNSFRRPGGFGPAAGLNAPVGGCAPLGV